MASEQSEYYFFPVRNEDHFTVQSIADYWKVINCIINAQVELQEDYPGKVCVVYYEADSGL